MSAAETIAMARDIALLVLVGVAVLAMLWLWIKVSGVLSSAKRTVRNAEDIVSTVSSRVVRPATAGSGVAFGAGKALAFLLGLARRRKKGENDG